MLLSSALALPVSASTTFTSSLSVGSSGTQVSALQTLLGQLGLFAGNPTGYFGSITRQALESLQSAYDLEPVGSIGPKTRSLLNQLAAVGSSANTANGAGFVSTSSPNTQPPISPNVTPGAGTPNSNASSTGLVGDVVLQNLPRVLPSLPIVSFHVSSTSVLSDSSVLLTWQTIRATSCTAGGSWSGQVGLYGSKEIQHLTEDKTFTLTCAGLRGTESQTIKVSVRSSDTPPVPPTTPPVTPPLPTDPGTLTNTTSYEQYPGCEAPAHEYLRALYIDPVHGSDTGTGSVTAPLKTLENALGAKKILPGDHVILLAGNHGTVFATKYAQAYLYGNKKWIWLDFKPGAIAQRIELRDMSHWLITNAEVSSTKNTLVMFGGGSDMVFTKAHLYTVADSTNWGVSDWIDVASSGISVRNTTCVAVTDNSLKNVRFGISVSSDSLDTNQSRMSVLVSNNEIRNFSGDGMRPIASNVIMKDNRIYDEYVSGADGDGNHDDGIQMFALNGRVFDNIVIDHNWIQETTDPSRKWNAGLQGISNFDGIYTNVKITNNVVLVSAYHGISMYGARTTLIDHNTVANPTTNGHKTWIYIPNSKGGIAPRDTVVSNNVAVLIHGQPGATYTNNIAVTDPVAAYTTFDITHALFDLHPKSGGPLAGRGAGVY